MSEVNFLENGQLEERKGDERVITRWIIGK
jgi:hypothetical protein